MSNVGKRKLSDATQAGKDPAGGKGQGGQGPSAKAKGLAKGDVQAMSQGDRDASFGGRTSFRSASVGQPWQGLPERSQPSQPSQPWRGQRRQAAQEAKAQEVQQRCGAGSPTGSAAGEGTSGK